MMRQFTSALCYEFNRHTKTFVTEVINLQMLLLAVGNHFALVTQKISTEIHFAYLE
jgi:hypothetical protein